MACAVAKGRVMPKVPPAGVIAVTERARAGLGALRQKMVPPSIALLDDINDFWAFHIVFALAELRAMIVHGGGRERTAEEYRALYASAGFALTRIIPTAGPTSIIEGRPA